MSRDSRITRPVKEYTHARHITAHFHCVSRPDLDRQMKEYFLEYPREGYGTMVESQPKYDFVNLEWTAVLNRLASCD